MKKLAMLFLIAFLLMACGSGSTTPTMPPADDPAIVIPPDDDPVVIPPADDPAIAIVDFSCISVDNDQICTGIEDYPGIWNSGPIQTTGIPMPVDFLNLEITNNSQINTSVFAYTMMTINGCGDDPIAFDAVFLLPGDMATFSYSTKNVRCGMLGYQETVVSLYNAAGFNPLDYPNPWTYPRTDLILNATVQWENRLHSDMP